MSPVSAITCKTAIILIDIQNAFHNSIYHGEHRNNAALETNIQNLLNAIRSWNREQILANEKLEDQSARTVDIIHIRHQTTNEKSPFHPSFKATVIPTATSGTAEKEAQQIEVLGIDPMPCAQEIEGEPIFFKDVNSAFIGTSLETHLRERLIRQLLICGISTDHCVSTSTRMAANLKVVNSLDGVDQGKILVIEDGCAAFQRGSFPADLVHQVQLASLNNEFAEITSTQDVLSFVLTE